jgi:fucose permease
VAGFSFGPIFPTTIAMMSRMVPERVLASAIGFMAAAGSIGGALFPWIAGNLAQSLGLWVLLPYVIGLAFLMMLCWLLFQANPAEQNQPKGAETQVQ